MKDKQIIEDQKEFVDELDNSDELLGADSMDEDEITVTISTDEKLEDVQTTEEKEPLDSDQTVDNTQ